MCGRYLLVTPSETLRRAFRFVEQPNLPPAWNIAPTQLRPVLRQRREPKGERTLQLLRWGLIPPWAESAAIGARMINARAETLDQKPAFRTAFRRRRCLVPADGFYEWTSGPDGARKPWLIRRRDRGLIAFAGLWDRWQDPAGIPVDSFAIVTCQASGAIAHLHHRMPVMVEADDHASWLDPDGEPAALAALLRPAEGELLEACPVSTRVNDVRNDDAELARPIQAPDEAAASGPGAGR
jgi:putative SOS response-associated peptidase YedK